MLWCAVRALTADAWATPLERVEFESASQRLVSGGLIRGDRIQGDLAKPDGAGPFPAVIVLHGCAGMHDTTKQKLVDELVGWGYVVLLVDSFATRGIDHACTSGAFATFLMRRPDAYGAWSSWLAKPSSIHTVWLRSASRLALGLPSLWQRPIRSNCSSLHSNLRFRAAAAFNPPCQGRQRHVRGYPRSSSLGPSTIGRRRQTAPIKSPAGATTGRQSSSLSIPARTMDSITSTSSPEGYCLVTGWNTTARQRTMRITACTGFSIATLNEGMPIAATEIDFHPGDTKPN